jgi:N-formylglutamate deformylase
MSPPFHIRRPAGRRLPLIVSCPHSGTEVPLEIGATLAPELARSLPDTDWFVDELYGFAPALGITLLHARYSRYVIDLNRDPGGAKLYADGRQETALVPVTTFAGEPLYHGAAPDTAEIKRRLALYYQPYHDAAASLIDELRRAHRHVLFYEAHSIKRLVKTIRPTPFPDLMLGDQRGKTAAPALTAAALAALRRGRYAVSHNEPFMGGYLTRRFGQPATGVHALQLEMAQDVYMDEARAARDPARVGAMQEVLRATLLDLARAVEALT